LYGIVDLAVNYVSHAGTTDANGGSNTNSLVNSPVTLAGASTAGLVNPVAINSANTNGKPQNAVTGLLNGGLSPSRWGIKGSEDLGNGLAAVFTLESGINAATGTVPNGRIAVSNAQANSTETSQEGSYDGQLFARESTVGFKSTSWGEVRLGRQLSPMADAIGQFDVNSGYMDPLGFNGGYAGGGFTAESRWDNSIKYTIAPNSMFKTSVMYRLPDTGNARQAVAGAAYLNLSNVRFAAFASKNNDSQLAGAGATAGTLKVTFADTKSTALLAAVDATPTLTFKGGWERIVTANPSNPVYDATMTNLSGVTVSATSVTAFTLARTENMYWIGASYAATPTIKVNGSFYERTTSQYGASATCTPNGVNGGVGSATACATSSAKYYVGEVIDSLSKRTDVYLNASYTQIAGPVWSNYFPNQVSLAVGMRHNF
jgi:predicted porin